MLGFSLLLLSLHIWDSKIDMCLINNLKMQDSYMSLQRVIRINVLQADSCQACRQGMCAALWSSARIIIGCLVQGLLCWIQLHYFHAVWDGHNIIVGAVQYKKAPISPACHCMSCMLRCSLFWVEGSRLYGCCVAVPLRPLWIDCSWESSSGSSAGLSKSAELLPQCTQYWKDDLFPTPPSFLERLFGEMYSGRGLRRGFIGDLCPSMMGQADIAQSSESMRLLDVFSALKFKSSWSMSHASLTA